MTPSSILARMASLCSFSSLSFSRVTLSSDESLESSESGSFFPDGKSLVNISFKNIPSSVFYET